jgi:hypothetical protein
MGCGGWKIILCISKICFYSITYMTLFVSLLYIKNVAHKYLRHLANNSIQKFLLLEWNSISMIQTGR